MQKRIAILGSTGSIGTQTLDVISRMPEHFQVEALAAGNNIELLLEQIRTFRPKMVSVLHPSSAEELKPHVPSDIKIVYGEEGLVEVAAHTDADFVVSALVGSVGLVPTLAAIQAGKHIGLANKETLVTAGHIVTELVDRHNVQLLPIDSEHSAIFQCLQGENVQQIAKITLTASGGSFRDFTREQLENVTIEQALNHPNWSMGAKITIDSATMVNKGLEVIEAHWLFRLPYDKIDVVIHPQSIVHSMVEFVDRSVIAQLGNPDMRIPIQYALSYPERMPSASPPLNLIEVGRLDFMKMDMARYPCLKMAYDCGRTGGSMPVVFNAANEVAVSMFLEGKISFLQIEDIIYHALEQHEVVKQPSLDDILQIDQQVRQRAREMI